MHGFMGSLELIHVFHQNKYCLHDILSSSLKHILEFNTKPFTIYKGYQKVQVAWVYTYDLFRPEGITSPVIST